MQFYEKPTKNPKFMIAKHSKWICNSIRWHCHTIPLDSFQNARSCSSTFYSLCAIRKHFSIVWITCSIRSQTNRVNNDETLEYLSFEANVTRHTQKAIMMFTHSLELSMTQRIFASSVWLVCFMCVFVFPIEVWEKT